MATKATREDIRVWRNKDSVGIEYRSGFAVAEPYPKHWHDEYQLCLITEGGGELVYRGARHDTPAASLFIVHPGEVHSNQTATGCSFRSIYIEPRVVAGIRSEYSAADSLPFFRDAVTVESELIADFVLLHQASEDGFSTLEHEFLLRRLLFGLTSRQLPATIALPKDGREASTVDRIREYISDNYDRTITHADLEHLTGLSTFHLNRLFSKAVGLPPHAYQTQVRVSAAKKLIRHGSSLAEAAVAVGFADQSHLHRHFLRLTKITPGEYFKASKNVQ